MNRRNICMVAPLYHLSEGGLGKQAQLLTERLARSDVNIFTICRKLAGINADYYHSNVTRIWTPWAHISILEDIGIKSIIISMLFSLGCAWVLFKKRKDYDIVHFHGARIALYINLPLLKLLRKKVIAKVSTANHTLEVGSLKGTHCYIGDLVARLARKTDRYVAISDEIERGLIRDGIEKEKIVRIANFINSDEYKDISDERRASLKKRYGLDDKSVVLFAGRLVPRKGFQYLLNSLPEVVAQRNDVKLLVLGDGPMKDKYEKIATDLGFGSSVLFMGWKNNVRDYMSIADIYVQPSLQEGFSNSLLEAMALGLPVVATEIGGSEDIIDNEINGLLVKPGDSRSIASATIQLLGDKDKAHRLGKNAMETIKRDYDLEVIYKKYITLYQTL